MSAEKIALQNYMTAPQTQAVFAALSEGGFSARFVGGCVRDTLLGRAIRDIDIATDAVPDDILRCLRNANLRAIPTGIDHGTVTAIAGGTSFEITTLRRDVETDGRHAKVQFTDDWEGDAARRDLTINAMSLEMDGTLHDPFGGKADLAAGRIRFVGDSRDRITEDVLRLLRYFRFHAHFGRPPPDQEALDACRALAPQLPTLSGERVRAELLKLLEAPNPLPALRLMAHVQVLDHFMPEATGLSRLARLIAIEADGEIAIDPVRRLAAVLVASVSELQEIAERLRLSNAERGFLLMFAKGALSSTLDAVARRRLIYRLGAANVRELVLLGWAGDDEGTHWEAFLEEVENWIPRTFPITGEDVLARGVDAGPAVGTLLRAVEVWWVDGNFAAGTDECLDRLDWEIGKTAAE
jgi:poly(A) polymerase